MIDLPWNALGGLFTGMLMAGIATWMLVRSLREGSHWTRWSAPWIWRPRLKQVSREQNAMEFWLGNLIMLVAACAGLTMATWSLLQAM